ncbi:MAG TPA: pyridoxamine 5'-phosphate oxidase family protein [Tepidisphaeraceae bacterium]|jgi:hypothetical protein|nr:pyridoxamine 5'-phosphate oxidase family protein [Tepidisphaeraceae bacterium]
MAKPHDAITSELADLIRAQPMFFVATAPLSPQGRVNLSPKGLDTFRILSPKRVAYLDLTGSGNETAAHLLENTRITFMFLTFDDPPKILRLYGRGKVVLPNDDEWPELRSCFPDLPGTRQVIVADIDRVQTSCGFGVPLMRLAAHRDMLPKWAERKGPRGLQEYRAEKNRYSIDGLPTPGSNDGRLSD